MYAGLRSFHQTFFGRVARLEAASEVVFQRCKDADISLFHIEEGWKGWPEDASQDHVLDWFAELSKKMAELAEDDQLIPTLPRRPLAQPNRPIRGSTKIRKLDIGFVNNTKAPENFRWH